MRLSIPEKYRSYFSNGQIYIAPHTSYSLNLYNYKDCKELFRFFKDLFDKKGTPQRRIAWNYVRGGTVKINYNEGEITIPQWILDKIFKDGAPEEDPLYPKFERRNLGLFVYWKEYLINNN
jgi:DNA-binding transcriptional regulator/RsmH inhibitor MraZ